MPSPGRGAPVRCLLEDRVYEKEKGPEADGWVAARRGMNETAGPGCLQEGGTQPGVMTKLYPKQRNHQP